jgi:hypothetical protein
MFHVIKNNDCQAIYYDLDSAMKEAKRIDGYVVEITDDGDLVGTHYP